MYVERYKSRDLKSTELTWLTYLPPNYDNSNGHLRESCSAIHAVITVSICCNDVGCNSPDINYNTSSHLEKSPEIRKMKNMIQKTIFVISTLLKNRIFLHIESTYKTSVVSITPWEMKLIIKFYRHRFSVSQLTK